jgi:hypothetical protein
MQGEHYFRAGRLMILIPEGLNYTWLAGFAPSIIQD